MRILLATLMLAQVSSGSKEISSLKSFELYGRLNSLYICDVGRVSARVFSGRYYGTEMPFSFDLTVIQFQRGDTLFALYQYDMARHHLLAAYYSVQSSTAPKDTPLTEPIWNERLTKEAPNVYALMHPQEGAQQEGARHDCKNPFNLYPQPVMGDQGASYENTD